MSSQVALLDLNSLRLTRGFEFDSRVLLSSEQVY
jgi:hypothetical protein